MLVRKTNLSSKGSSDISELLKKTRENAQNAGMQKVARKTGSSEKVAEQLVKSGLAAGPVTGTSFAAAFIWEISARFPRLKKATEDPGDEFWRERDKANMAKCKNYNFRAYHSFGISLRYCTMLMMRKIPQAMQDDAIWTAGIHPAFIPVTGLKCFKMW